jgi:hypothetical protein
MQTTAEPSATPGQAGLEITRIGFGARAFGGGGWQFGWDDLTLIEGRAR